jgi:hypothetical protein
VAAVAQELVQPDRLAHRVLAQPGDVRGTVTSSRSGAVKVAGPHVLGHDRTVRVAHEELGLAGEERRRVAAAGVDAGPRGPDRAPDHLLANRMTFQVVGVQQPVGRGAPDRELQLPAEVDGILHAGVHALRTRGRVDVRRVTGKETRPTL